MQKNVATNERYYKAFNEYLSTHTLNQAVTDGYIQSNGKVFPVNFDMFFGFLVDKIVLSYIREHAFVDKLDKLYGQDITVGAVIEDKLTVLKGKNYEYDTKDFESDVPNPYAKSKKGISVVFHRVSDFKKLKVTVSYDQIRTGCLTEYGINDIVMNIDEHTVTRNGKLIELTLKEFDILKLLLEKKGKVVSRDELLGEALESRTIDMHINSIRKKINDMDSKIIKTVYGVGYKVIEWKEN